MITLTQTLTHSLLNFFSLNNAMLLLSFEVGCFNIDLQFNFRFIYMNRDMFSKVEGVEKYPILLFHKYIFCTKNIIFNFSDYKSQEN